jgi:hypothetical protein
MKRSKLKSSNRPKWYVLGSKTCGPFTKKSSVVTNYVKYEILKQFSGNRKKLIHAIVKVR